MELGEMVAMPDLAVTDDIRQTLREAWQKFRPQKPVVHARLKLLEVDFKANITVEKDTLGDFGNPEWKAGRADQFPVCYARQAKITLAVKFGVTTKPTATENVAIKGKATLGGINIEWTGSVSVSPGDNEVTTPDIMAATPTANQVDCYDKARIEWEMQAPTEPWIGLGASENVIYSLLSFPSGTPPHWTLLDVSCRGARGATTEQELVEKTFSQFPSRSINRMRDGKALTYWNPKTTVCTNTQMLLASADGSGQCGSWAHFLLDMYKVHGVTSGEKVIIVRTKADHASSNVGFLVKNWTFVGKGSRPAPFTHVTGTECKDEPPGIPGQSNPDPVPAFFNHFIVKGFSKFYDPSYGGGPVSNQTDWENGAIDGLFSSPLHASGFKKKAATLLLEFWSVTTGKRL